MRSMTQYDHEPDAVTIERRGSEADLWIRQDIREEANEEGSCFVADEAYMVLPADEAPDAEEVMEAFEEWFEYAAEWEPEKPVSLKQLRADVDYLMAMQEV